MTLLKAIESFDRQRENDMAQDQKLKFINELDLKIFSEILEIRGCKGFEPYTERTPQNTELLAPEEYSEIYTYYLNMKLDYINQEIGRFNNSAMLFNRLYKEMGDFINRKNPPLKKVKIKAGDLYV